METRSVDPAAIAVWRWQATIASVVATVGGMIVAALLGGGAWFVLAAAISIGAFTLAWLWPPLHHEHLRYGLDDAGISIESGVLWRSQVALPRVRIQHTDVSQGPLERHYGLGTLKLYTAGSRYTRIELPGLAHQDAEALRNALLARGGESGV
jgi:membrane protein YdbS with pleckstrin-like domain